MSNRPAKKRAYEENAVAVVEAESAQQSLQVISRTTTQTFGKTSLPPFVLEQQIESLKIELEYERSGRALDLKRAQAAKERVEKQLEIAVEEAQDATTALEESRQQSEKIIQQLRNERNKAIEEYRQSQIEHLEGNMLDESENEDDSEEEEEEEEGDEPVFAGETPAKQRQSNRHARTPLEVSSMSNVWQEKCHHLEHVLENQKLKEEELNSKLEILQADMKAHKQELLDKASQQLPVSPSKLMEEATPAVMKEMNRVRIALSETERRERQMKRKLEDLQRRNQSLIQEREEGKLAQERLPIVQEELQELRQQYETLVVQHQAWNEFGASLEKIVFDDTVGVAANSTPRTKGGPPELFTIQRFLETAKTRASDLEKQAASLLEQNKQLKSKTIPLEAQILELSEETQNIRREKWQTERQLEQSKRQVTQLETQQTIYRREIENLQSLIKTFDDLPLASKSSVGSGTSDTSDNSKRALEISLASIKEELKVITKEKEQLLKEAQETQKELDRVKEKFGKLRDALHSERAKAESAEQRANEAEALAGKGSFNPETTRVLHLQETPLAEALKEEIKVLKRQLEVANKSSNAAGKSQPHADPAKLNQRLKENFKEQIALFREGVYLMTGFKVDMLPGTDRTTFRVRSMFAEQEEDHLMLKWPKGENVSSLDILNTDWAKSLSKSPPYEYMTKFHSLPAFMASAQLSLFEKQTIMI